MIKYIKSKTMCTWTHQDSKGEWRCDEGEYGRNTVSTLDTPAGIHCHCCCAEFSLGDAVSFLCDSCQLLVHYHCVVIDAVEEHGGYGYYRCTDCEERG